MKTQNYLALALAFAIKAASADAQVVINEFCASSDSIPVMGQVSDWIELYNTGDEPINLKGYGLSDNPRKPGKYIIDKDIQIYPQSYRIVLCNGLGTDLNTSFKLSGDGSESVVLSDPNGDVIDEIGIPKLWRDYSYGRIADGGGKWGEYDHATPGFTNSASQALSPMPSLSIAAGFYVSAFNLQAACSDPGAAIYYTTDGSLPTEKSAQYNGQIKVSKTEVVRAIAVVPGMKASPAATATYFVGSRSIDLPVVSLSTDRKNFYDDRIGIYVAGTNGISGNCQDFPKNWNQPWERPVHIEYFDKAKKLVLSQDAGIKITGSCSRGNDMKSLRVIARKQYGDNRLRYKFFDKKGLSEFKSIVLRNGGNDFGGTMLRDAVITGLAGESLDVDIQAYQPAAVFLNGEYLGLHNVREKVSTHFVEENYGADADKVDLVENNSSLIDGSSSEYKTLISFVQSNSLANQSNYDKVASQIDISNFIDYWCAQIYVDNEDWPNNNIKYYKPRAANAKWRWVLFGAEYSCGVYGGQPNVNSIHHSIDPSTGRLGSSEWGGLLMRKLLQNEGFKNQFIQRMSYTIEHTFRPERVAQFIDSLADDVYNEWEYHGKRWFKGWHERGAWRNDVNNLISWFDRRPPYIREYVRQYFGLGDSYNLDVEADCAGAKFSMNGSMATADISGLYFGGAGIKLEAKLPSGREIDHWEISGNSGMQKSVFGYGDTWSYFDLGKAPAANWKIADEGSLEGWKSGKAPLGFSPSWTPATKIEAGPENSRYSAYYFRKTVEISNPSQIVSASLTIKADDGAVVYLNGKEQGRYMMNDGAVNYSTWSSTYVSDLEETVVILNPAHFVEGSNIIAVEVHQTNSTSSDLWMEAKMDIKVEDASSGADKKYGESISLNLASSTKVRLITKAAQDPGCESRAASVQGAIVINEVSIRNFGNLSDETCHYPAWVEFYNTSSQAIDMAGLYVMDQTNEYRIPCGQPSATMIPANGYLVFFLDGRTDLGASHLGINMAASDGEAAIYLGEVVNGTEQFVDWIEVPQVKKGCSYGRKQDGGKAWITFQATTPYSSNAQGQALPDAPLYTNASSGDIAPGNLPVVEAYPNPATDIVYLKAGDGDAAIRYEIFSMSGQLLMRGEGISVNIQPLPSDMYLLRVDAKGYKSGIKLIKK